MTDCSYSLFDYLLVQWL